MRTSDPFLNEHLVDSYVFHIGGRLWPISIRDQMLRGRLVIDKALEQGLIHRDRSVAVVGAGAAGVTAALRAADKGVPVTLFEKTGRLFARHALCSTRWVNPTQYDWPAGHWDASALPWPGTPSMPLTWEKPDYANALATEWRAQFNRKYSRLSTFLTVKLSSVADTPPKAVSPDLVRVEWSDDTGKNRKDFGMVVLAMGFGEEKCYLYPGHPYRGFEFWANDPFALPNLGCAKPPRILISGGGDGSLQDFLRITTKCKSAEEVWRGLPVSAQRILGELRDVEEQALRAFGLGSGLDFSSDCPMLNQLHSHYDTLTKTVHRNPRVQKALDRLIRDDFVFLNVVYPCTHYSQSYALNRFLVLLVAHHLECVRPCLAPILYDNRAVVDVQCQGSHTPGDPAICYGQPHEVFFKQKNACSMRLPPPPWTPDDTQGIFDVVIVRHGIEPTPLRAGYGSGAPMPPLRQLLPYHLPT